MSGYTWQSGVATQTVSLFCPTCCQRRCFEEDQWWALQQAAYVRARYLYCSEQCREDHTTQLVLEAARHVAVFSYGRFGELQMLLDGVIPQKIAERLVGG